MIKYLGSKRTLLDTIEQVMSVIPETRSVVDLFSGTSRVGHHLKGAGYQVFSNDLNTYAYALATCYVQADKINHESEVKALLKKWHPSNLHLDTSPKTFAKTLGSFSHIMAQKWTP